MIAASTSGTDEGESTANQGLVQGHAYALTMVKQCGDFRMLRYSTQPTAAQYSPVPGAFSDFALSSRSDQRRLCALPPVPALRIGSATHGASSNGVATGQTIRRSGKNTATCATWHARSLHSPPLLPPTLSHSSPCSHTRAVSLPSRYAVHWRSLVGVKLPTMASFGWNLMISAPTSRASTSAVRLSPAQPGPLPWNAAGVLAYPVHAHSQPRST